VSIRIGHAKLIETFGQLRSCGAGRRECQVLWVSPWSDPETINSVVHPRHRSHGAGFELDSAWLTRFWNELAATKSGVRVQVHTHSGLAFHSGTDDRYPIVHTAGFLSLVIPNFALGPEGIAETYLAEIGSDGEWRSVPVTEYLEIV